MVVPFMDLPTQALLSTASATKQINHYVPSGFCTYSTFAYGEVKDPLRLYGVKDCIVVFCKHIESEAKRLFNMFPEMTMKRFRKNRESLKG